MKLTLEELRRRFSVEESTKNEEVEQHYSAFRQRFFEPKGEGDDDGRVNVEEVSRRRGRKNPKRYFEETVNGRDARLLFGKFKGRLVSEIASVEEGQNYLRWVCAKEFPDRLIEICKIYISGGGS